MIKIKEAELARMKFVYQYERADVESSAVFQSITKRFADTRLPKNFEYLCFDLRE